MSKRTPKYCHHKASGQAVVRIDGRDFYLGTYDSPESRAEYNRLLAEWFAGGQSLPPRQPTSGLSVNELLLAYLRHADQHYRRPDDGTPSSEIHCIKSAVRPLKQLYGHTSAADFGPLSLKAVRQKMVETAHPTTGRTWCRRVVNANVGRIKAVFKWAVENELVPPSVHHGLQAVRGLHRGRTDARETEPVRPVSEAVVSETLPYLNRHVRGMVRVQMLTGARPGEVCRMRACDID